MVQKKSVSKPAAKKPAKSVTTVRPAAAKSAKGAKAAAVVPKPAGKALKPAAKKKTSPPVKLQAKPVAAVRTAPAKTSPPRVAATRPATPKAAAPKTAMAKTAVSKVIAKTPVRVPKPAQKIIQTPKQESMAKDKIEKKIPANGKVAEKLPTVAISEAADLSDRMAYGMYGGVVVCQNPKPFPKKTPYTDREIKTVRDILTEERKRLRDVLRSLDEMTLRRPNDEVDSTVPTHLAENATDNQNTETNLLLRRDQESALRQVESAMERLEGGLFGVCLGCGSKIGIDRLKAKPEAHLCMSCQRVYAEKASGR